jgi:hypothetical protein
MSENESTMHAKLLQRFAHRCHRMVSMLLFQLHGLLMPRRKSSPGRRALRANENQDAVTTPAAGHEGTTAGVAGDARGRSASPAG